jgi:subtilisin family serine protease
MRAEQSVGALAAELQAFVLKRFRSGNVYHLRLPSHTSVDDALRLLRGRVAVQAASPNYYRYLDAIPSDPSFGQMWGLHNTGQTGGTPDADIDAPEAWNVTTGSDEVVVAVIDSGADLDHPDLAANLWVNPGEDLNGNGVVDAGESNGVDDDGNGFVDDFFGWDFTDEDNHPAPAGGACVGHGTHTAGTVGAVGDNGVGVTGVSQNVKLMILKTFRPMLLLFCSATDADLLQAIDYTTLMGVRVSSNSWGGTGFSSIMRDSIRRTRSLFVVAAGNGGTDGVGDNNDFTPQYPASYDLDNIVSVAATTHTDALARFSNFGVQSVDLGAPGADILSTLPNGYGSLSGTSMATPHVSGVAALLLAQDPTYTVNELKDRILRGVDRIGALDGRSVSGGRLNANRTLRAPQASATGVSIDVVVNGSGSLSPGDTLSFTAALTNHTGSTRVVSAVVFAQLPSGEVSNVAGPGSVTMQPFQTRSAPFTVAVPLNAPSGLYFLVGQVVNPDSLDEDLVEVTVSR